jgi:hypothetical protein
MDVGDLSAQQVTHQILLALAHRARRPEDLAALLDAPTSCRGSARRPPLRPDSAAIRARSRGPRRAPRRAVMRP